jgi:hypothetical protein
MDSSYTGYEGRVFSDELHGSVDELYNDMSRIRASEWIPGTDDVYDVRGRLLPGWRDDLNKEESKGCVKSY